KNLGANSDAAVLADGNERADKSSQSDVGGMSNYGRGIDQRFASLLRMQHLRDQRESEFWFCHFNSTRRVDCSGDRNDQARRATAVRGCKQLLILHVSN